MIFKFEMRKVLNSGSTLSFNNSYSTENLQKSGSKKTGNVQKPKTLKEHVSVMINQIIANSVEKAISRMKVLEIHEFVTQSFGGCFDTSIELTFLNSQKPISGIHEKIPDFIETEHEPEPIRFENWSRGCVEIMSGIYRTKKGPPMISGQNSDITTISNIGQESTHGRISSRKPSVNQKIIREIQNEPSFNGILQAGNDSKLVINEEPLVLDQEPIIKLGYQKHVKLQIARSMSINTEMLEDSLRTKKILEFTNSRFGNGYLPKEEETNNKRRMKNGLIGNEDRVISSIKLNERTFGITGEIQDIKSIKNDRLKPLMQHAK